MLTVLRKKHRVHSLTGRITLPLMHKAFKAVKRNRGAAGIDKQSIAMFEANLENNLAALQLDLKSGSYQPLPLRRSYIPKAPGKFRPLGIPSIRCRIAQEVIRSLINPIFERTFHHRSHGFRSGHSCHSAMYDLIKLHQQGYNSVVDADIQAFFDNIPHQLIIDSVAREISDGNILRIIRKFLQAGIIEDGHFKPTRKGTPQGGVISPLLANIVLNHLDWMLHAQGYHFVRYADDFLVVCKSKAQASKALLAVTHFIQQNLGLQLSPEKTRITTFGKGFDFLGFYISAYTIRMSHKAEQLFKMKLRAATVRSHNLDGNVVEHVNRIIRGTVNYFFTSFSSNLGQFNELDRWIRKRIRCMKFKRVWMTDNKRFKKRQIRRMGFITCRELCLAKG